MREGTLRQEFAEVLGVGPRIGGPGELRDTRAGGVIHTPDRTAAPVPMDEGLRAVALIGAAQSAELTGGEAQERSRLGRRDGAAVQGSENGQALLGTLRQDDRLPIHASRIREGGRADMFTETLGRT